MASTPYLVFFTSLRTVTDLDTHHIFVRADPYVDPRAYNAPNAFQVAAMARG